MFGLEGCLNQETSNSEKPKPKLLDQVRNTARRQPLSHKTEEVYINFIERYQVFHNANQGVQSATWKQGFTGNN